MNERVECDIRQYLIPACFKTMAFVVSESADRRIRK